MDGQHHYWNCCCVTTLSSLIPYKRVWYRPELHITAPRWLSGFLVLFSLDHRDIVRAYTQRNISINPSQIPTCCPCPHFCVLYTQRKATLVGGKLIRSLVCVLGYIPPCDWRNSQRMFHFSFEFEFIIWILIQIMNLN